jgi:hypothetical protein
MEVALPVSGYSPRGAGRGLIERMMLWWGEWRTVVELFGAVVPEPVLAGFEAADQGVTGIGRVVAGVLRGGGVATADVPALGAAPEMKPPTACRQAFGASGAGGRSRGVNRSFV